MSTQQLEQPFTVADYWKEQGESAIAPMPTRSELETVLPPRTRPQVLPPLPAPPFSNRTPQPWFVPLAMVSVPSACMMIVGLAWIFSQGSDTGITRSTIEANTAIAIAAAKRPISYTCVLAWQCPNPSNQGEVQAVQGQSLNVQTVSAPIAPVVPNVGSSPRTLTIVAPANVRVAPSVTARSVGVLQAGAAVEVADQARVFSDGIEWVPTVPGWVASSLVQ